MGWKFGLRRCWLWLELGFGNLPVIAASVAAPTVAATDTSAIFAHHV